MFGGITLKLIGKYLQRWIFLHQRKKRAVVVPSHTLVVFLHPVRIPIENKMANL
jgi:hypothetical protein